MREAIRPPLRLCWKFHRLPQPASFLFILGFHGRDALDFSLCCLPNSASRVQEGLVAALLPDYLRSFHLFVYALIRKSLTFELILWRIRLVQHTTLSKTWRRTSKSTLEDTNTWKTQWDSLLIPSIEEPKKISKNSSTWNALLKKSRRKIMRWVFECQTWSRTKYNAKWKKSCLNNQLQFNLAAYQSFYEMKVFLYKERSLTYLIFCIKIFPQKAFL